MKYRKYMLLFVLCGSALTSAPVLGMEDSEDTAYWHVQKHLKAIVVLAKDTLDNGDGNEYCFARNVIPATIDMLCPGIWEQLRTRQEGIYQEIYTEIQKQDELATPRPQIVSPVSSMSSLEEKSSKRIQGNISRLLDNFRSKQQNNPKTADRELAEQTVRQSLQKDWYEIGYECKQSFVQMVLDAAQGQPTYSPTTTTTTTTTGYSALPDNTGYQYPVAPQNWVVPTAAPVAVVQQIPAGQYDKLSMLVEVSPETATAIRQAVNTGGAKGQLPDGVELRRYPDAALHISLDCFNYDHPSDPNLHTYFGDAEVNYLFRAMARFAGSKKRQQGAYAGTGYDLQLWCHTKSPNQHFHFSMQDNAEENVFGINNLPSIMAANGNSIDFANLILRVGTQGKFRNDWNAQVHGPKGMIAEQDAEAKGKGKREMTPYLLDYAQFKMHITLARIDKTTKAPFGPTEWGVLQKAYKNIVNKYKNVVSIPIETVVVSTRVNKKMTPLGKPVSLKK